MQPNTLGARRPGRRTPRKSHETAGRPKGEYRSARREGTPMTKIRIGVAGMGTAGLAFVAPIRKHLDFEWVAFAEPDANVRQRCEQMHGVAGYASFDAMLEHRGLDAVCI